MPQMNVTIEQDYIDELRAAAEARGWSLVDCLRYSISMLAREQVPPGLAPIAMCEQVYTPTLDKAREHLARDEVREAGEAVNRVPDAAMRDFALFLCVTIESMDRMLARLAAENASRLMVGLN